MSLLRLGVVQQFDLKLKLFPLILYFRRLAAIQYDVRLIEQNACTFNEAGTDIVKNARMVTELCLRMIK